MSGPANGHFGVEDLAQRVSTAGLEPDQTSFNDLGCDFQFAELVLNGLERDIPTDDLTQNRQVADYGRQQIEKYIQLL